MNNEELLFTDLIYKNKLSEINQIKWSNKLKQINLLFEDNKIIDLSLVIFPESIKKIRLEFFNQDLDNIYFPEKLEILNLGNLFNKPLNSLSRYKYLKQLYLGYSYNRHFHINDCLPDSLEEIVFGRRFNKSIDNIIWPSNLKYLRFGDKFNQKIDETKFPKKLEILIFGDYFNQTIDHENKSYLPNKLELLSFGRNFNQPIYYLPATLEILELDEKYDYHLTNISVTPHLEIIFRKINYQVADRLPKNLRFLKIIELDIPLFFLPNKLEELIVMKDENNFLEKSIIPLTCSIRR